MTGRADRDVPDDDLRLRAEARSHGNVVPVPFLGTTWQERGAAYWRRRVGAVALFVLLTLFVGALAVGFTIGILGGSGHGPVGVGLAVVYDLTAVPGFLTGLRRTGAPGGGRGRAPRTLVPSGCLAFVLAPFGTGLCLAVLGSMFGHDFLNEGRARNVTATIRH
jgi:hypothetical protein